MSIAIFNDKPIQSTAYLIFVSYIKHILCDTMNFLAHGGSLIKRCQVTFITTPIATDIICKSYFQPPQALKPLQYESKIIHEQYKSMVTGNLRFLSGYSSPSRIIQICL